MIVFRRLFNKTFINHIPFKSTYVTGSEVDANAITENGIRSILSNKFPGAKNIKVEDTSGGCGAMFNIYVETDEFKGLSVIKQHRLIYDALDSQIKSIHGLHLVTKSPS